jgi:hypothetical protein
MMLANVLEKEELAKTVQRDAVVLAQAAHWRRYDLDRLLDNPQLWARAAKLLMDPALRDAKVGVGPKPTICLEEAYAHLVNPVAQEHLEAVCSRLGLRAPWLVSPESIPQVRLGQVARRRDS